jgi:hypothetical protein
MSRSPPAHGADDHRPIIWASPLACGGDFLLASSLLGLFVPRAGVPWASTDTLKISGVSQAATVACTSAIASASATIAAPSNELWAMANSAAGGCPAPRAVPVVAVVGKRNSTAAALCASQGQDELSRPCLGVLRTAAGEALSTDDIAGRVIAAKGFDVGDAILRAAIRKQVGSTVKRLHRNGAIENIGAGRARRWRLVGS